MVFPKSEESDFQSRKILRFVDFIDLDSKFGLALVPKALKQEGSSFGFRPSIYILIGCYDELNQKLHVTAILNHYSEMVCHKGFKENPCILSGHFLFQSLAVKKLTEKFSLIFGTRGMMLSLRIIVSYNIYVRVTCICKIMKQSALSL